MKAELKAKQMLAADGLNVYEPGQHDGICKAPYVVVHCYGNYQTVQNARVSYALLQLHCYVPLNGGQNAALAELCDRVKRIMQGMRSQAINTGVEGPDMVESDWKAMSRTIEYQILKANGE